MSCRPVVSSPQSTRAGGYATPAALAFSLAIALIAAAVLQRSVSQMTLARADLSLTQVQYALSGAQLTAAAEVVRSTKAPPYHWSFTTDVGFVDAIAEPEASKLSLGAASKLDDATFAAFGVAQPADLRAKLLAAVGGALLDDVGSFDPSDVWRRCARRLISSLGGQTTYTYLSPTEPGLGEKQQSWRIGEAWRIRVTTATGWRDERIVRFTGDAGHPAATVVHTLSRDHGDGAQCETILRAVSSGGGGPAGTP